MRTTHTPTILVLAAAIWAAAALPATADWLVTREGAELETRGPWRVQGNIVLFTQLNGTFSSLPVLDLDLDRSAQVTTDKDAPIRSTPPPEKKVVLTLGRDDLPPARPARLPVVDPEPSPGGGGADPSGDDDATDRPPSFYDRLAVAQWDRVEQPWLEGVEIVGRLTNQNRTTAMEISLTVRLYGDDGEDLASGTAFLESRSLLSGQSQEFRVPFEGIRDFADARFDVLATEVVLGVGQIDAFDTDTDVDEADLDENP